MRFGRHGGIYRSDVGQTRTQSRGGNRATSRRSVPSPGKRTRREDHALLIVRDEFRPGYSLNGLLASRARLRFTGYRQNKRWTAKLKPNIIERQLRLFLRVSPKGSTPLSV